MAPRSAVLLHHLRRLVSRPCADPAADAELLDRFVRRRDEMAFAALVERHGPMVLRLCRRVLADPHAAEDAFQAVFLVLARRAAAVRPREAVAGWLHGVAYRVARKAQAANSRRQRREEPSADLAPPDPRPDPLAELTVRELLTALDEEVQRLPRAYRLPVILCCLEGHTQEEASRLLGWTPGSVRGRLERGRARLRDRLTRRGLTLPAALAAVGIGQGAASAGLPAALASATARAAVVFTAAGGAPAGAISARVAALAEGGLKGMAAANLKIGAALVLLTSVLVGGAGLAAYQAQATKPPADLGEVVSRLGAREEGQPESEKPPRTDRYGDPLPDGVLARMGSGRLRHGGARNMAFSPDGKTLISAGTDDLRVWDVATGKLARRTSIKSGRPLIKNARTLVCDLSAAAITVASLDSKACVLTCQVFDPTTGKAREPIEFKAPDRAEVLAVSPGGKRIAVSHSDPQKRALLLYDASTGQETLRIPVPGTWITHAAFAPDASTIAVCGMNNDTVRIHDTTTGQLVWELKREGDKVWDLVFAPDGRSLASIPNFVVDPSKPGEVSIWDLTTGKERYRLKAEPGWVGKVAFSPDSRFLATGGYSQHVILWDLATGQETRRLFTRDLIAVNAFSLAFSPDGKVLATSVRGAISLWDVATGQRLPASAEPGTQVVTIRFSRDGQRLIGFADVPIAWEAATGREVRRFADVPTSGGIGASTVLSPDESLIAATAADGTIRLHDAVTGKEVRTLKGHEKGIWTIQFAADGRRLISSSSDKTIRVWDVASGQELLKMTTNDEEVIWLTTSPDGRWLASCSQRRSPRGDYPFLIWDLTTGREVQRLTPRLERPLPTLAFSPDSRLAAAMSGETRQRESIYDLQVWEVATGKEQGGFVTNERVVVGPITFSPDGRMLATGGGDSTVRLWELASGRQRMQFNGHESGIAFTDGVAFSPDGRVLAAASPDAPVYLWDVVGHLEKRALTLAQLEQAWADLRSEDATAAFRAIRWMINAPEQAVPFLRKQVQPATPVEAKRLARLIADLDKESFEIRQQAATELEELGEQAEPALRQALAGQPTPEARRRLEQLVEKLAGAVPSPDRLRLLRSGEVLEGIGTPEARQLLEKLTRGAPEARQTQEAKASLERLAKRPGTRP